MTNFKVAEILVIRQAILKKRKCIIVLPFVSIVTEKTKHFKNILRGLDLDIASFHGGARHVDVWDIAICTIEKVARITCRSPSGKFAYQCYDGRDQS
jgi:replicative superfamily II helicase